MLLCEDFQCNETSLFRNLFDFSSFCRADIASELTFRRDEFTCVFVCVFAPYNLVERWMNPIENGNGFKYSFNAKCKMQDDDNNSLDENVLSA